MTQNLAGYNRRKYGACNKPRWEQRYDQKPVKSSGDRLIELLDKATATIRRNHPELTLQEAQQKAAEWARSKGLLKVPNDP